MIQALKQKGFTLVEILVYFGLFAVILFVAMTFSLQILDISQKSDNYHELQANVNFITQKITSKIQEAQSIDDANSTFDADLGQLSLNVADAAKSPTIFSIDEGQIYIKEGNDPETQISSDFIGCTLFRFEKNEFPKTPDQIIMDMTFISLYGKDTLAPEMHVNNAISLRPNE